MSHVCLSIQSWSTAAASSGAEPRAAALLSVLPDLLAQAPRVVLGTAGDAGHLWADARGLHAPTLAAQLLKVLRKHGIPARAGTALTPIGAVAAATWNPDTPHLVSQSMNAGIASIRKSSKGLPAITNVRTGDDRAFIAEFPIELLSPELTLAHLLEGIGVERCGQLAELDAASVEVRLGAEGVKLWELARANDPRQIFRAPLRALPSASFEWTDYTLRDSERLLFVINSLLGAVCDALAGQGERALELSLRFSLADRSRPSYPLHSARPTADRSRWFRQVRALLDQIKLDDAVTGVSLCVESVTGNDGAQGDLFDRGFASAGAVETTLAQLADDQDAPVMSPRVSQHPLADRRTDWTVEDPSAVATGRARRVGQVTTSGAPQLTLQLLPSPRPIAVTTEARRDTRVPTQYRDGGQWHRLVDVAGPDRISGGHWEDAYAREYFRGVREDGMMVWLYRLPGVRASMVAENEERTADNWFFQGWWD